MNFSFFCENGLLKKRFLTYKFLLSPYWTKLRKFENFLFYHGNLDIILKNFRSLIKNPISYAFMVISLFSNFSVC